MGYDHQTPGQQAQGDEPLFPLSKAVVFEGDARPGKYLLGILEAEAMLGQVLPFLRLVPFVFHSVSNAIIALFVVTRKVGGGLLNIAIDNGACATEQNRIRLGEKHG